MCSPKCHFSFTQNFIQIFNLCPYFVLLLKNIQFANGQIGSDFQVFKRKCGISFKIVNFVFFVNNGKFCFFLAIIWLFFIQILSKIVNFVFSSKILRFCSFFVQNEFLMSLVISYAITLVETRQLVCEKKIWLDCIMVVAWSSGN